MPLSNDTGAPPNTRPAPPCSRKVAITFDDLPTQPPPPQHIESLREITELLLEAITANDVPALGFVNEGAFYNDGEIDTERVALLRMFG